MATRKASGAVLNAIGPSLPQLVGGSADLAPSNNTYIKGYPDQSSRVPGGRNFFFGVREHAMGSILNGMALSGLLLPYGGTFLIFSDYMRPAIRLAALMGLPVKYVFTHDSIFLGEDGPTHQPISQLLSLRSIPGLTTIRPADANETVAAWRVAIERLGGPTALALSRQSLPILAGTAEKASAGVARGGYVLSDPPTVIRRRSSSPRVPRSRFAWRRNSSSPTPRSPSASSACRPGSSSRPRSEEYRQSVLPRSISRRLAVEAGVSLGWERYTGGAGDILGIDGFGGSAPYKDLANKYGFTVDNVVRRARRLIEA